MRSKFKWIFTLLMALTMQFSFAQEKTITGVVSDANGPLPGVNVVIKGTQRGVSSGFDGSYSIKAKEGEQIVFSFMGMNDVVKTVGASNVINTVMQDDTKKLGEVVVTALNVKKDVKKVTHAVQQVSSEKLSITQAVDVKAGLAGKVAGVQVNGQAGSKLGSTGKIRLRGAISLNQDNDPLYILDGVFVDPNSIDMDNVASVSVLKGGNATALYGPKAEFGVILMTSKRGGKKMSVELSTSAVFDKVGYLPKYQNKYGQGYDGEATFAPFDFAALPYPADWSVFQGKNYVTGENNYADESWGPKLDGREFVPWYAWWPDSPYFGKTAKYTAQPNNIKDFYNIGSTIKNSLTISGGGDSFRGRLSYSNLDQAGITPNTNLKRHFLNTNFTFDFTPKFKVDGMLNLTTGSTLGEFDDTYGNQTSGSFNSWFGRDLNIHKLRELRNLETYDKYMATWNWWGPDYYADPAAGGSNADYKKPAFWFNPYTYLDRFKFTRRPTTYTMSISPSYEFNKNWSAKLTYNRTETTQDRRYYFPYSLAKSAGTSLYNDWQNAFGMLQSRQVEDYYEARLNYKQKFGDFDVDAFGGASINKFDFFRTNTDINQNTDVGGLVIPDLYTFTNASITPASGFFISKQAKDAIFFNSNFGYKDMVFLDTSVRSDWNSALTVTDINHIAVNNNGAITYAFGASLLLDKIFNINSDKVNSIKLRGGYAKVVGDYTALATEPVNIVTKPFGGTNNAMYMSGILVDKKLTPADNFNREVGLDMKFFGNRLGLSTTYYYETRKNDVLPVNISSGSGSATYVRNTGEVWRKGIEVALNSNIVKSDNRGFEWDLDANFARNKSYVVSVGAGLTATNLPDSQDDYSFVNVINMEGKEWGQMVGTGFVRDANGNKVVDAASGLYLTEAAHNFGSVLPKFTGGFINTFRYKGFELAASVDFQKGGKFFSLSEMWGQEGGLLRETASMNDKGNNIRDAVASGGGVHVVAVDATGAPVDTYVEAIDYYKQWFGNKLAEPFIHDASYIKLRDAKLSYTLPGKLFNNKIQSLQVGVVARNLFLISVSKDNTHRWDPSIMSGSYGESGQLPGTRSYGFNVKLNF